MEALVLNLFRVTYLKVSCVQGHTFILKVCFDLCRLHKLMLPLNVQIKDFKSQLDGALSKIISATSNMISELSYLFTVN